jgi:hypothetical protein
MALGIGCRTTPSHAPAAPPGPEPPASRRCTAPPGRPGLLDVPDVVARLRAAGLGADRTDEPIVSIFGGECAEVVRVNGLAVQVYRYATPAEAQQVLESAPQKPISWVGRPHFARLDNLFVTVVTDDEALASRIVASLQPRGVASDGTRRRIGAT